MLTCIIRGVAAFLIEIREEIDESRKILQSFWGTYDCRADSTAFDLRVYVDLTLLLGELW